MPYRVDTVPWFWRPAWLCYAWLTGVGAWVVLHCLHITCRLRVEGRERLGDRENFIYAFWHQAWFAWLVTFVRLPGRHAWLQHPAAYMKPVHVTVSLMGIRALLGSEGAEGRQAINTLCGLLRQGWSTVISPDGPRGPARVVKKGLLHLALESGVPIVPVRIHVEPHLSLRSWDRKIVPLPFARITVSFGEPVAVTEDTFADAGRRLARRMSDPGVGDASE